MKTVSPRVEYHSDSFVACLRRRTMTDEPSCNGLLLHSAIVTSFNVG